MKVALVGNQNSGKTSLFNVLTGANQKIGNWPGVTIEQKSGIIKGTKHKLIDLPGIYSLSPYTAEEKISRNFVMNENIDVIINIVDATSLERSLYLTTQLLELDCKVVVALNMCDMLDKKGLEINEELLALKLGVPVIKISALKRTGVQDLISLIASPNLEKSNIKIFEEPIEKEIDEVEQFLNVKNKRFASVKLLEKDVLFNNLHNKKIEDKINGLEKKYSCSLEEVFANQRYNFITSIKKETVKQKKVSPNITDKLDKFFLNKWLAIPTFILIMAAIYFLSVGVVGQATVDFVDGQISAFSEWFGAILENWGASEWAISLICDGIIAGVGAVLNFVPQLVILFICISLLETTGYMSRISFFLDKVFKKFGLSGKSLIPFIVGSGCSVPAIMSTRTIDDEKEKQATIMLTPFIPCSAKLPILTLFSGYFFSGSWIITTSLYAFAIIVILISAMVMRKFFFKGNSKTYISELPEYKLPSLNYVARDVFNKTAEFIKRAGTIILLCSVVIWIMLSFSWTFEYGVDIEDSILASIGNVFAWLFYPMLGEWSWAATVSAFQGLVAKEQVVSSMEIIAGFAESVPDGMLIFKSGIFSFFTGASAYAFMTFNLFSAPCFGAISAMRKELGTAKKTWIAIGFQTGLAWVLACMVFGIGSLIQLIF